MYLAVSFARHVAGGEADDLPGAVADGYHRAAPVAVVVAAPLVALQQAHLRHQLQRQAGGLREVQQVVPRVRGVADARLLGVLAAPAAFDVVACGLVLGLQQVLAEVFGAPLVDDEHAFALHALLLLFGGELLFLHLDAILPGQRADGLGEVHRLVLHEESDDVAAPPAAEAVPRAARRVDAEAGRLLLVQRAARPVHAALLPELDVPPDDVHRVGTVKQLFDDSFVYHRYRVLTS